MPYNPENGSTWVAVGDPVYCVRYGNGEITDINREEIVCLFSWWTGTLDKKQTHFHLVTLMKQNFTGRWYDQGEFGYWRLRSEDVPER